MLSEEESIRKIIENMAKAENTADKLGYDKSTKKIKPMSSLGRDPDGVIEITPEDLEFASRNPGNFAVIVVAAELIEKMAAGSNAVYFNCLDNGDVYNMIQEKAPTTGVPGTIYRSYDQEKIHISNIGKVNDQVRIIIRKNDCFAKTSPNDGPLNITGYVFRESEWKENPVSIVPVMSEIFSRTHGIIETDVFRKKRIGIVGLGSFGSTIALELAKSGGMNFALMDHDRYEICNVSRHVAGLPHTGRFKTKIIAQLIKERNPYANIRTFEEKVCWDNVEEMRGIVRWSDVVIICVDEKVPRIIFNRLCMEEGKVLIIAGAFRRAHGGQVLRIRPGKTPCYQCFLMLLPEQAGDEEIAGLDQAERLGYTDRPVPIEPGLSTDIAPISIMAAKIAIQELLKDTETTLRSLDEDLIAPWYLWLNRREKGTHYENLEPMEFNVGGIHVLRWYGIDLRRHPGCPVCGDFVGEIGRRYSLKKYED